MKTPLAKPETIDWENAHAHIIIRNNHVSLLSDGWAVSYMGSRKVWKRGFESLSSATKSLTAAYKRLQQIKGEQH